jgi:hypothetical protein
VKYGGPTVRQADIDAYFAGEMAAKGDARVLDVIFIGPSVGACIDCTMKRTRGEFEVWETLTWEYLVDEAKPGLPTEGPQTSVDLMCVEHTAERRKRAAEGGGAVQLTMVRTRTRLTDPITVEDP